MADLTCASCRHWHKADAPTLIVGQGEQGECRLAPPTALAIVSPQGIGVMAKYPPISATCPACGQHEGRGK